MLVEKLLLEGEHIGQEVLMLFILGSELFAAKLLCFFPHSLVVLLHLRLDLVFHLEGLSLGGTAFGFV